MANVEGEIVLYAVGMYHCSVCAEVTISPDDVARRVNLIHPAVTGDLEWHISESAMFADGTPHPTPCEKNPDTRIHRLLDCLQARPIRR